MVGRFRFTILVFGIFSAYAYLVFNLYSLQIEKSAYYSARAESQYKLAGFFEPHRGVIYFTDKENSLIPAALNKSYPVIFAVPKEIEDAKEAAHMLSPVLGIEEQDLEKSFNNKLALYRLLIKKAEPEQTQKIKELNISGIYMGDQEFRFYPFAGLAAHLIGFIGPTKDDDGAEGRYGVERRFNSLLKGVPGSVDGSKIIPPQQGKDLALTIDRNIQNRAEEILKNLIVQFRAVGGTVIVQNPKTGDVLAMGSYPGFDPNSYYNSEVSTFLNPAVQAVYEPGSVFKVITMATGFDLGAVAPDTTYIDTGKLTLNGRVIQNWDLKAHGKVTMREIIEQSINTGSAFAASEIGKNRFYDYLVKFGFDKSTGIQLPEEIVGNITNFKNSDKEVALATASFGQGISMTPIALIGAVSAIANGGTLMEPNLLKGEKPKEVRRVISKKTAGLITNIMISAVDKAFIASIPNYNVAGKTGTAQVPNFKSGGYTDDVINTYAGFAPASDPRFTILIKIDKPAGAPLAGLTVVPAFRELAEFILNYYNAPPDRISL